MAKTLIFRNRSTAGLSSITGTLAELWVDTSKSTVVVMDGITAGGSPLATESYANARQTSAVVTANAYTDAEISSAVSTLATQTYANARETSAVVTANAYTDGLIAGVEAGIVSTATTTVFGVVRPDGTSILVTSGVISANIATATSSLAGVVRPDGTSILVTSGVISANIDLAPVYTSLSSKADLAGATFTGAVQIQGLTTLQEITEVLNTKSGATGTVVHDFSTGSIFYHTSLSANFTANITNVPTTNNRIIGIALILIQGATPRVPTALQIDGGAQTIKWADGITPTGNTSKTDVVSFSLVRASSSWSVLATLNTFG